MLKIFKSAITSISIRRMSCIINFMWCFFFSLLTFVTINQYHEKNQSSLAGQFGSVSVLPDQQAPELCRTLQAISFSVRKTNGRKEEGDKTSTFSRISWNGQSSGETVILKTASSLRLMVASTFQELAAQPHSLFSTLLYPHGRLNWATYMGISAACV